MLKLEKEVRLGYGRGKARGYVSVVREHYLRDDIACKRDGCCICQELSCPDGRQHLTDSASHYVVPDVATLKDYLEVFEAPTITNIIIVQTAISHLRRKGGRQLYSRAVKLLDTIQKHCVIFSNEHHVESFVRRREAEEEEQWRERLVFTAGVWYVNHLQASGRTIPVVIVTQYPEHYARLGPSSMEGLLVMAVADYLACFWPEATDVHALCGSLEAALSTGRGKVGDGGYPKHLTQVEIAEGLRKSELVAGRLRVSRLHPRDEAVITPQPSSLQSLHKDIHIYGAANRNRAIHRDLVAVRILAQSDCRPQANALTPSPSSSSSGGEGSGVRCGVVVGVLDRAAREYVASFAETAENVRGKTEKVLVYPYDVRVPKIRVSTKQAEQLKNHRIVIRIDSWEVDSQYPNGHFVRSIGPIGDLETETAAILIEHGLTSAPFSKALLDELPVNTAEVPWEMEEEEVEQRRDLRHTHLVFSIDPRGCEDVDDTLSIRHLKNGVTELGVHIADVSYFVTPGSLTDREAQERATTIYLADRRYDMLPPILSADLCSLLSNVDRYAVSVVWKLDKDYHVKSVWYGRTVIRSRYKLAYEVAQSLYDGATAEQVTSEIPELASSTPAELRSKVEELRGAVRSLVEIARVFRDRRAEGGAVELESVEVRVQFSAPAEQAEPKIEDLVPKQGLEMHETVAECMIFANHWVAKRIYEAFPSFSLLRHHPPPSQDMFQSLRACCASRGFSLATDSNRELARSLDHCTDPRDPSVNKILRTLATHAMTPAEYLPSGSLPPEQFSHYGLALNFYTHFTSPIRRYADLLVHRQLLAAVCECDKLSLPTKTQLTELAHHMNTRHRAAQLAQGASTELFQTLYFMGEEGAKRSEVTGVISGIRSSGVMVMVPRYGIRGPVYLRDKNGQVAQPSSDGTVIFEEGSLEPTDSGVTVSYPGGCFSFKLFDHVRVRVGVNQSHAHPHSFVLVLLSCQRVEPPQNEDGRGRKELVRTVAAEARERVEVVGAGVSGEYSQSSSSRSLYCLLQDLHRLSLHKDN